MKTDVRMSNKKNGYIVKPFQNYSLMDPARFGIKIVFERDIDETYRILINYHLISALLALLASINFFFDPKDTNRSCMLVALLLVFATIFSTAQVNQTLSCLTLVV